MSKVITIVAIICLVGTAVFLFRFDFSSKVTEGTVDSVVKQMPAEPQEEVLFSEENSAPVAEMGAWTRSLYDAYTANPDDVSMAALERFDEWMAADDRDPIKGVELARARRVSLNALARLNPTKAWDFFIPLAERTGLPPEVVAELAEPVDTMGDWQPSAVCYDPNLPFSVFYEATLAGSNEPEYALPVNYLEDVGNPKGIPLHGYRLDGIAVFDTTEEAAMAASYEDLAEGDVALAPGESEAGSQDSLPFTSRPKNNKNLGWRTAIYMRTTWNGWTNNQSESGAYSQWRTVNDLMMSNSKGRYQLLMTVTPVIDMKTHAATYGYSPDISTYDVTGLRAAVKDVAEKHYGYKMSDYGHKIIYWKNGPGEFGGLASLPGGDISLKTTSTSTAYHELGHNMNFHHSGFLKDEGAEDNYRGTMDLLGVWEEYGNPFDIMGYWSTVGGNASFYEAHFCAAAAHRWGWLKGNEVYDFKESGTFRIHAFDEDTVQQDRRYAILYNRMDGRQLYLSYYKNINKGPNADAHRNGARLEVIKDPLAGSNIKPGLLDATYWSKHERQDANIPIGMTFRDQEDGLFITPLARAADRSWMDVHVHQGYDLDNRAPVISSFTASTTTPGTGQTVNFSVTASDPDGDPLAYHWYFDEDDCNWHQNMNQPSTSFSWGAHSYRSVICTVTDMKGGVATVQKLITVGSPSDYYITGQVVNKFGDPVTSVPVDNGRPMTDAGDNLINGHRSTLTDTNGVYYLTRLQNGTYPVRARVYGDIGDAHFSDDDVTVSGAPVTGIDRVIREIRISAAASSIDENGGSTTFTISRDPSYSAQQSLPVRFIGKAVLNEDFTLNPAPVNGAYTIPQNQSFLDITVTALADSKVEGPEDIRMVFELNRQFSLVNPVHGVVWINDDESSLPRVRLAPVGRIVQENGGTEKIRATRFGDTSGPLTVNLGTTGPVVYGTDFTIIGGLSHVIPSGEDYVDIIVQGIDDDETEGRETININLADGAYVKDSQNGATLYIADDDIAVLSVDAIDPDAAEENVNPGTFRITRTGDLQDDLYVEYNALGVALHGTDYVALPGDLIIPAGKAYADVTILPRVDAISEGAESVQLWLTSSERHYHLDVYSDVVTIYENALLESQVTLAALSPAEELGEVAGLYRVSRSAAGSPYPFTDLVDDNGVWLQAVNGTEGRPMTVADASDPVLAPNAGSQYFKATTGAWWRGVCARQFGNLTVEAGTYTVSFYVGDADTSTLFWSEYASPSGGNHVGLTATDPAAPVLPDMSATDGSLINKLDANVTAVFNTSAIPVDGQWVQWSISYTVPENSPLIGRELGFLYRKPNKSAPQSTGAFDGPLVIDFEPLDSGGGFDSALVVDYQIDGGSATEGADYASLSGSVTIPSGQTNAVIEILPFADGVPEGDETVILSLLPKSGYVATAVSVVNHILDHPMDTWRVEQFGANASNPAVGGDSANPDGDRLNNLQEWALATDPLLSDTPGVSSVESNEFVLIYDRRMNSGFNIGTSWSASLTEPDWRTDGLTETVIGGDGVDVETIRAAIPITGTHKYLRIELEQ